MLKTQNGSIQLTERLESTDLARFIGKNLGHSSWIQVDQTTIDQFADLGGDHQWIHVDSERAGRESPFGRTIAHGYLILSLAPRLLNEIFNVSDATMGVNRGFDKVRFISPLLSGDRIQLSAQLLDVLAKRDWVDLKLKLTFEGEGYAAPVCVAELLKRFYLTPAT